METGTSSNPSCKDADCLSLLPTHVVLHILSFSPMESIAKLSLTSKKYRDLCLSIQSMFISDSKMKFSNSVHRLQYLKFLVKFMRDRQHAEMTKFSLWWSMEELSPNENFHIMRLIKYPIMCHVENLKLTLNLQSGAFMLTPELLALTNLTINLRGGNLKLPFQNGFAHLKCLSLLRVKIKDEDFGERISFTCKFLKALTLHHLSGIKTLQISSSSLQVIEVQCCSFESIELKGEILEVITISWAFDSSRITSLHVSAPVLIDLYWWGYFPFNYFLKKSNCLHKALLNVRHPNSSRFKLNGLLPSIVHVPRLIINSSTIMALYRDGCLPFTFSNLLRLEIDLTDATCTDVMEQALTMFLRGLPRSLKELIIKDDSFPPLYSDWGRGDRTIFLEFENLEFLQGLEEIHVELVCKMYEIWLLEYLLKHAKVLKKVTIIFEPTMPRTVTDKLNAAALARGGNLCFEGQKMVFELK